MKYAILISTTSALLTLVKGITLPTDGLKESVLKVLDKIDEQEFDETLTHIKPEEKKIPSWYSSSEECKRDCTEHGYPKVCYYKFVLEHYSVNGGACIICTKNASDPDCQCILADGVEKSVVSANRAIPGPPIEVCLGDKVVIDVVNDLEGAEVTIHWHGILQLGTPYYDGVPYVTQCPIHHGNTFRYRWEAVNEGTHFWHSHTGFQKLDGLSGSIIIRNPCDVHSHLYDYDDHVLIINDWLHETAMSRFPGRLTGNVGQDPDNLLINGKGTFIGGAVDTPIEVFVVRPGKRYRFRIIAALATTCPLQLAVEGHKLLAIATDGEPFLPVEVETLRVFSAERYDVIINTNQQRGSFWIQLKSVGFCADLKLNQLAILKYSNSNGIPSTPAPTPDNSLPEFNGRILNPADGDCGMGRQDAICVSDLTTADPPDYRIGKPQPDVKIFLPFRFLTRNLSELFTPGEYDAFLVVTGGFHLTAFIDGISYQSPSRPLIIQLKEGEPIYYCNSEHMTEDCVNCVCTHMIPIPYDSVVEIVIVDEAGIPGLSHPFHLHGYAFHVVSEGVLDDPEEKMDLRKAVELEMEEKIARRLEDAPRKDTIPVPTNGYVALRFVADNPGFWFFHCHFMYHMAIGMEMVLQVGNFSHIPPIPKGFPKCGSYIPNHW